MSLACVGLVTASLMLLDRTVAANLVPIAYLIPVVIAATQWGIWPALLASIASMAAADFFFFPPIFSFQVEDPKEVIDLLLFLVVALVSGNLASRLRQETETLRRREKDIQHLYEFSRRLAACFAASDLISAIENYLSRTLGQPAAFFATRADGRFEPPKSGSVPKVVQEKVTSMIARTDTPAQTMIDGPTSDVWLLSVVSSENAILGLVAIDIGGGSSESIALKTSRVEAILEEVSLTLQRIDIEKAMEDARLRLQGQLLRDAFHGTLSHELCTPLAAIRGSASVLDSMPVIGGTIGLARWLKPYPTKSQNSTALSIALSMQRGSPPAVSARTSNGLIQGTSSTLRSRPERDGWRHTRSRRNLPKTCHWSTSIRV